MKIRSRDFEKNGRGGVGHCQMPQVLPKVAEEVYFDYLQTIHHLC